LELIYQNKNKPEPLTAVAKISNFEIRVQKFTERVAAI